MYSARASWAKEGALKLKLPGNPASETQEVCLNHTVVNGGTVVVLFPCVVFFQFLF